MIRPNKKKAGPSFPIVKKGAEGMILGTQMIDQFVDSDGFNHLACTCSGFLMKKWCEHIESIYTDPSDPDREYVSSTTGVQLYKEPNSLHVDVLVLASTLSTKGSAKVKAVGSSDMKLDNGLSEVKILWGEINKVNNGFEAAGTESIGYIVRGVNGRRTIRRLIFEWLVAVPTVYKKMMICRSGFHLFGACYFDQADGAPLSVGVTQLLQSNDQVKALKNESWKLRDAFCLIDSGFCYTCLDTMGVQQDLL